MRAQHFKFMMEKINTREKKTKKERKKDGKSDIKNVK